MKVLWFSHLVPYPETGLGVLQRSYHLVRELARAHDVYLLAFVQRKIIGDLLGDVEAGLQRAREHLSAYCAAVQFLPIPCERARFGRIWTAARSLAGGDPYTIRWLSSDGARKAAAQWSASVRFDVVHFDTLSLAPYREIFPKVPSSLDHHNIESDMMFRRARIEREPLKRLYFWQEAVRLRRFEREFCPQFDLNITCSSLDAERLESFTSGLDIATIPNGVDTEYFRPSSEPESPQSLVFAGNMSWYPNASAMLYFADKVWPALKEVLPDVTMDIIGGNPPPRLSALAARDENFRVRGFVPDIRPYASRAALYVCPIMDGGGTKLKILDALAMGKPIVAHPVACEGIAVRDGEHVVLAREPREFVHGIVKLLQDRQKRREMSERGRELAVSSYSCTAVGARLISELERVQVSHSAKLAAIGRGSLGSSVPRPGGSSSA